MCCNSVSGSKGSVASLELYHNKELDPKLVVVRLDIFGVSVWQNVWIWAAEGTSGARFTERVTLSWDSVSHK